MLPAQIYINGKFLTQRVTGVQRYAYELVKHWDQLISQGEMSSKLQITILAPKHTSVNLPLKHIALKKVGALSGSLWEQLELPFYSRKGLLLNLCNAAPLLRKNQIVTIHDMSVFLQANTYSFAFQTWYRLMLSILSRRVKKVITVSDFSLSEIEKYCKTERGKCAVIYHGKEHVFEVQPDPSILQRHELQPFRYVLAVSSVNPNKNFQLIAEAIELLGESEIEVVIAGGMLSKVFNGRINLGSRKNIKYVGYVSDEELRALYEHAGCFVYPSFYEGFGFPPLEAMSLGCPVIVANTSSLPEVCQDAAIYINPDQPMELAKSIEKIMTDQSSREMLVRKGLKNASRFSWNLCAKQTFQLVEEEAM